MTPVPWVAVAARQLTLLLEGVCCLCIPTVCCYHRKKRYLVKQNEHYVPDSDLL